MSRQDYYRSPNRVRSPKRRRSGLKWALFGSTVVAVIVAFALHYHANPASAAAKTGQNPGQNHNAVASTGKTSTGHSTEQAAAKPNPCAGNSLDKLALVSISQRHLWACQGTTSVYDSAVVTGMENLPADLTPTGTYHVYGKETNLYLNGSDSTGSWHDYVYYWMPFLDNQYGAYGFHDATWRPADAFGNISPYSSNASHGCVELPLATAKWLYNWVVIGTTVTIES